VLGVADEGTFGDFEDEAAEREVGVFGGETDVPGEGTVAQLGEGDVDGEGEVLGDVVGGRKDGTQQMAREKTIQSGFFREGDELVGKNDPTARMMPTRENLEAGEDAGAQLYDGLEEGFNLVRLQRPAEVGLSVVGHTERRSSLP